MLDYSTALGRLSEQCVCSLSKIDQELMAVEHASDPSFKISVRPFEERICMEPSARFSK